MLYFGGFQKSKGVLFSFPHQKFSGLESNIQVCVMPSCLTTIRTAEIFYLLSEHLYSAVCLSNINSVNSLCLLSCFHQLHHTFLQVVI